MRTLRIALLLLTIASPVFSQPEQEIPKLVPWIPPTEDTPGKFFMGAIYPQTAANGAMSFLLDATMTTPEGLNYFGMGLKLRTTRPAFYRIVWRHPSGWEYPVRHVGSTCFSTGNNAIPSFAHAATLAMGKREGMRLTGRETVGAGAGELTSAMNNMNPVYMFECANDSGGPPFERRIHILLPEPRIQFSGSLIITALYFELPPPSQTLVEVPEPLDVDCVFGDCNPPTTPSPPLVLPLFRAPPRVLVLGDSVAWGQGIGAEKAGSLVTEDMRTRYERVRMTMKAHSGARIRLGDAARISEVNTDDCLTDRSLAGEIPRPRPSVQCQIIDAVSSECFVRENDIGVVPIPTMRCHDMLDQSSPGNRELRFNFDHGPAFDLVILWGCVNDVNPFSIFTGMLGDLTDGILTQRTRDRCNLRNGLLDIREFLPNAKIAVNQYHTIVSSLTAFSRSNCGVAEVTRMFESLILLGSPPFFATNVGIQASAARSVIFRNTSTDALRRSVDALNQDTIAQDRRGRGAIQFLTYPFFDPPAGAFWASDDPLVFPLRCNSEGLLAPIDPRRFLRANACATEYSVSALDPFRLTDNIDFMSCVRASGLHPNQRANRFMADRIISARVSLYPRMMNFRLPGAAIVNPEGSRR